ncbi:hypothetical protein [Pseudomonas sp. TUM22785]|uniref:hypothetical protein n=1 Tax=Pseudomonas sp. TUM22785 TaxID=3019098 RepID=UPI0023058B24|nr:hypothetical protein [Pseudomonas sp. TUM22785]WCD79177.1 hypothetical protein PI990_24760 [Pseudomonas sp. TUM22785]
MTGYDLMDQIPYYLNRESGEGLLKELENYSSATPMYSTKEHEGILQGDCWTGLRIFNFDAGTQQEIRGIVLSNSCDVDPNNKRDIASKISFSPIIPYSAIEKMIKGACSAESAESKLRAIKEQKNTQFMFLPAQGVLSEDYVIWFSDINSIRADAFLRNTNKEKIVTLSMVGFYMFVFKLSIHLCRFHEKVDR